MNKILNLIKDIYLIRELRHRIGNTLFFLFIFRVGSYIVLPGVDVSQISGNVKGILGLLDSFLGGSFSRATVFALGVAPYISASIIMQLLGIAWPKIQKIQREGEMGQRKVNQITRLLTIFLAIIQSTQYLYFICHISHGTLFSSLSSIVILTAGNIFCMWLGEKITDKGIGNGITMLIMVGIVASFPNALYQEAVNRGSKGALLFVFELFFLYAVILFVISYTQATRKIPIQYARQLSSGITYGGQRQYIPFKLNSVGVMPVIFANIFNVLLVFILQLIGKKIELLGIVGGMLQNDSHWLHNLLFVGWVVAFTFFYTAVFVNPIQIAEDMKRANSFIPGITSGNATARFLGEVTNRLTLPAALFLAAIAILPVFVRMAGVTKEFAGFCGGTSLLIVVSSMLETIQQIDSYLLLRHYEVIISPGIQAK